MCRGHFSVLPGSKSGFLLKDVQKMHVVIISHHMGNVCNAMVGVGKQLLAVVNPACDHILLYGGVEQLFIEGMQIGRTDR